MLDVPTRPMTDAGTSAAEPVAGAERAQFLGYRRADGRVGTRNYLAIVSSVNCSATVSRGVAAHFARSGRLDAFENVDGIVALTHGGGCAVNMFTQGYDYLTRALAGYATHPNVGAVLMIGLGCETNQIPLLLQKHGLSEGPLLRTMTIQATGGTKATIEAGIAAIEDMLPLVDAERRSAVSAEHLTLALCDGAGTTSANPALGHAADLLVRQGGTVVLAQTPSLFGGEALIADRAARPDVAEALDRRLRAWQDEAERGATALAGSDSGTMPSQRAAAALAKAGASPLEAVYDYGEAIAAKGLVFMDSPSYEPVAVTGQIAGGCNLVAFTTQRDGVPSFKPAPCLTIATSTPVFESAGGEIDLDGGAVAAGAETVEEAGARIFAALLRAASGEPTKAELFDFGDNAFAPWQVGAVM